VARGFNNVVALTASGQPAGVSIVFNPSSLSAPGSGTSTVTFGVGSSVPVGSYPIAITAIGGAVTHTTTVTLTVTGAVIPQNAWTLKYVDSQETSCGNVPALFAFDGNPTTMWHTQWCPSPLAPPHEIQINLGSSYNLVGFQYLPRQDHNDNGKIKQYEFYVSSDGNAWTLVSSGVLMSMPGDQSQKTVTFTATQGQYVRLRELTEINGGPFASMAELNLLASNLGGTPDFSIAASPAAVSVTEGGSTSSTITTTVIGGFANSIALTASGQPAGVSITFNSSSFPAPGPGASTMNISVNHAAIGTYPITVTAIGGGFTHTAVVNLTVMASAVPQSGWTIKYVDSQETSCGNLPATLSFDGNPATMWHTQWCPSPPAPPHEIQINLGSSYSLVGFQYLPRQDHNDNGKIKQYEFYVSSDGNLWTLVSSGVLITTPGDQSRKTVTFTAIQGQYVRLRELTEINGGPFASMAELNVLAQ